MQSYQCNSWTMQRLEGKLAFSRGFFVFFCSLSHMGPSLGSKQSCFFTILQLVTSPTTMQTQVIVKMSLMYLGGQFTIIA